jgi:Tfp pilus assembly protein PilF
MSAVEYFWAFCRLNHQAHPLFWEPDGQFQKLLEPYLRPQGLLFAFTPWQEVTLTAAVRQTHKDVVAQAIQQIMHGTHDVEARALLAEKLNFLGLYFQRRNLAADAAAMYQVGFLLAPHRFDLRNNYGGLLMAQRHFPEALEQFQRAYHTEPFNPIVNKNLGLLFLLWGQYSQATHFLERTLTLERPQWDTMALLGEVYIRLGRFPEATQALRSALMYYEGNSLKQEPVPAPLSAVVGWTRETLQALTQGETTQLVPHPFLHLGDTSTQGEAHMTGKDDS